MRLKNALSRSAAIIHVDIVPTVPSTDGLSRLTSIMDNRD
jgi:hypothetical protein